MLIFIIIISITGYSEFIPTILIIQNNSYDHAVLCNVNNAFVVQNLDSLNNSETGKQKSDLFYYILGILILIVSGIIFKQRYSEYLKERKKL